MQTHHRDKHLRWRTNYWHKHPIVEVIHSSIVYECCRPILENQTKVKTDSAFERRIWQLSRRKDITLVVIRPEFLGLKKGESSCKKNFIDKNYGKNGGREINRGSNLLSHFWNQFFDYSFGVSEKLKNFHYFCIFSNALIFKRYSLVYAISSLFQIAAPKDFFA